MKPPLLGALALALSLSATLAHDSMGERNWIADGHFISPIDGSHCCGIYDCAVIEKDDVTEIVNGLHVRGTVTYGAGQGTIAQRIDEIVPHTEVQRSRDGRYWRCKKPDGSRRCFFAPPPST